MARISAGEVARLVRVGLLQPHRPILAHIVVTRYCNLDCAYCNEYDKVSKPVPLDELKRRIDKLAELGTLIVTLTGGEPLAHPDHAAIIAHIRARGMAATTITNGFLLTRAAIEAMNAAGLQGLQISIDGVQPDEVSNKTLKSLQRRLELLAEHALFPVNINSVLGLGDERAADVVTVRDAALKLGFSHTIGVMHDGSGTLVPLTKVQHDTYEQLVDEGPVAHRFNRWLFQRNLVNGRPNGWHCRAGARYIYICEDGLVHYCSQRRGSPGTPLADYGKADIRREFGTVKSCAPLCTVSCVHQASAMDRLRPARGALV